MPQPDLKDLGIEIATSEFIANPNTWIVVSHELGKKLIANGWAKPITVEKVLLPDEEELSILAEEAMNLSTRLNKICIALMKAEPDKRTALHCIASYLQVQAQELRFYLDNGSRGT